MSDNNMTDYLQSLRVRPPKLPPCGYEKTVGANNVVYRLESKRDSQKYKLDVELQQSSQTSQNNRRMANNPTDMLFPRKDPSNKNSPAIFVTNTRRKVKGLSLSLRIDQER